MEVSGTDFCGKDKELSSGKNYGGFTLPDTDTDTNKKWVQL